MSSSASIRVSYLIMVWGTVCLPISGSDSTIAKDLLVKHNGTLAPQRTQLERWYEWAFHNWRISQSCHGALGRVILMSSCSRHSTAPLRSELRIYLIFMSFSFAVVGLEFLRTNAGNPENQWKVKSCAFLCSRQNNASHLCVTQSALASTMAYDLIVIKDFIWNILPPLWSVSLH